MRRPRLQTTGIGLGAMAALAIFVACTETPTGMVGVGAEHTVAFDGVDKKLKPTLHFARVKSDGTLVDGTALSAFRFNEGVYILEFPPPIDKCAGAVNSASFQGFDGSVHGIAATVGIGVGSGGVYNDKNVMIQLVTTSSGTEDSSFTLVLVCP